MKTYVFSGLLFLLLFSVLNAQPTKGTVVLGGNISYQKSSTEGNTINEDFIVSPGIGFFVSDNAMLGISVGYQNTQSSMRESDIININRISSNSKLFTISPFFKYYLPLDNNINLFGQAAISLGFGETNSTVYITSFPLPIDPVKMQNDITAFSFSLNPGISFSLSSRFLLEASIGFISYSKTTYETDGFLSDNESTNENYNLSLNLNSITFGILFIL